MNAIDRTTRTPTLHCAIYTRKSSEEGLEQEFNSLDAQREACEAYVRSQKHAGWQVLAEMYDDGGLSGGTMERPALQRLLADVRAGKVQIVVVYKIDRLTRSLFDFAKIVETLDARGASFVSVTQQFNTTTSMGRLTLNVLLSFAQFEREITGERIRDKIAASKAKGMWMGGNVPLGYVVRERKLEIDPEAAEKVRAIFRRYAELGTVALLKAELDRAGMMIGGRSLGRGALYHMLSNRIYRGEITHKGRAFAGLHAAIIEPELWDTVQTAARSQPGGAQPRGRGGASKPADRADRRWRGPAHGADAFGQAWQARPALSLLCVDRRQWRCSDSQHQPGPTAAHPRRRCRGAGQRPAAILPRIAFGTG